MTITKDTGGPAFPSKGLPNATDDRFEDRDGMTLRDYGAFKALQGFCANPAIFAANGMSGWDLVNCTEEQLCQVAYRLADAMLKARAQ